MYHSVTRAIVALLFAAVLTCSAQTRERVFISTGEYSPWTSEALKHQGFVSHVISTAFAEKNIEAEFHFYPWKRAWHVVEKGEYVASSYWYPAEGREIQFLMSDAVNQEEIVLFYLKSNPLKDWNTLADLKEVVIGATDGYTYSTEFWNAHKSGTLNVHMAIRDELNMRKLIHGRLDAALFEKFVGLDILHREFDPVIVYSISYHPKPVVSPTSHLLFSRSHPDGPRLHKLFNEGLARIRENGTYLKMQNDLLRGDYRIE